MKIFNYFSRIFRFNKDKKIYPSSNDETTQKEITICQNHIAIDIESNKIECSICLEYCENNNSKIITNCNHTFHYTCIKQSLMTNSNNHLCPLCRSQIKYINTDNKSIDIDELLRIHRREQIENHTENNIENNIEYNRFYLKPRWRLYNFLKNIVNKIDIIEYVGNIFYYIGNTRIFNYIYRFINYLEEHNVILYFTINLILIAFLILDTYIYIITLIGIFILYVAMQIVALFMDTLINIIMISIFLSYKLFVI